MKTVIVYSHPYEKSYNHAILESAIEGCRKNGHEVDVMDLYKDHFNPVMDINDLLGFVKHYQVDPQSKDYGERIKDADHLVLIFPIWWGIMPAIMKGFIDKVVAPGSFYDYNDDKVTMHTTINPDIKVTIITTMNTEKERYKSYFGNAIEGALIRGTFNTVGIDKVEWKSLNMVKEVSMEQRKQWLEEVADLMK